ncbi:MAG: PfkB family carbohydrate kinase [Actinobacteria bacterium]|nr:PfkB family carbohydrate kinase [Actinomycetota bacterium]
MKNNSDIKNLKKDIDIICIGEVLIDFFAIQSGVNLREVKEFRRIAGGAPANVAVGASRLGRDTAKKQILEFYRLLMWEEKLIYGPYVHHVAGIHDHCSPVLYEATKYIPGLKPDPAQPTEVEIRSYLCGNDLDE